MITIVKIKHILLLFGVMLMFSCGKVYVDYDVYEDIVLENKSSHTITISRSADADYTAQSYLPESVTLSPDDVCEIRVLTNTLCSDFGTATFDSKVIIDYQSTPRNAYSITNNSNYIVKQIGDSKYHYQYIYTFIDADYENALLYGTIIE